MFGHHPEGVDPLDLRHPQRLVLAHLAAPMAIDEAGPTKPAAGVIVASPAMQPVAAPNIVVAGHALRHVQAGAVLHCPTIKPLDDATILAEVRKPGRLVVVAENHSIVGGLGEAVASLLMREGVMPSKFRMLALPDEFLDAGALPTLHDRYGISAEKMNSRIKAWLA